ncbi:MAG: TIGR04282 family arsenosugar biosynthesis glycosyltransferase [Clostridia bacterium]|nr:TIGR04282 family arsenosugar biosynthesis glycosyltransferase [Clostridia bacterium]
MVVNNAFLVMSRAPRPGLTKTRLMPGLSPEEACRVHAFILNRVAGIVNTLPGKCCLFYIGGSPADFQGLVPDRFEFQLQQGSDLGERMANAFSLVFQAGAGKAIMVGSDIPLLGAGHFQETLVRLERADLVLGPNFDGGYYLIAMKENWPQLFQGQEWGTGSVLTRTMARASKLGLKTELLAPEIDIDRVEDIRELCAFLAGGELKDEQWWEIYEFFISYLKTEEEKS